MSKLKLWGQPRSINVQKVLWALSELGLEYEREDAGGAFGKVREPAYLALNPNGLVPTLEVDGESLWESNAILRFLFARFGKAPTHPADAIARAKADAWTDWHASTLWPPTRVLLVQLFRTPEAQRDRAAIEVAHGQASQAFALLDGELAKHAYAVGDAFTWADIPLAAAAQRWFGLPIKRAPAPYLEAWYARVRERPGFKQWIDLPLS